MNFKTTLLVSKIAIFIIVVLSLSLTFIYYKNESIKDMKQHIKDEISFQKRNIILPLQRANNALQSKKELFKTVHKDALEQLKLNPNLELNELKETLKKKYNIANTEIDLFLIDKSLIIYKTTFKQDLHFNLSKRANISKILNKTKIDGKIYFLERIVADVTDMKYKTYSYSKLTKDSFLELGFTDNNLKNIFTHYLGELQSKNVNLNIYNVSRIRDEFFYFPLIIKDNNISKNEYFEKFKKFRENEPQNDNVMKAFFSNKSLSLDKNNKYTVFTKLYKKKILEPFVFQNIVVKLEIDLSEKEKFLQSIKTIFFISLLAAIFIMLFIFIAIKEKLIKPINIITQNIKKENEIPLENFKNKNNELYSIASEYNILYRKLNNEIDKNKKMSYIDHLTKINNRKSFDKKLQELITSLKRYNTPFSIMLFDVDDFKEVNDSYGHHKGDEVLIDIANLIGKTVRKSDFVFRVGGEEFAILFPHTNLENCRIIAEKIRTNIEEKFKNLREKSLTISSGIYQAKSSDDLNSIYKQVDSFLYKAKKEGKNTIIS